MGGFLSILLHYLTFKGLFEIFILYLLFYALLRFIQRTPGLGIFKGVLIFLCGAVLLISVVFKEVQLTQLTHIVQEWLFPWLILGLIVVFQPELRQAFHKLGQTRLFKRRPRRNQVQEIEKVARAVRAMAEKKIGALLVFERDIPLSLLTEQAVRLEARVDRELIFILFSKASPYHDGAMVLGEGRIQSVRCFFTLHPEVLDYARDWGARHRAALSATCETDALAVVVSEETGRISLASHGKLYVGIAAGHLEEVLKRLLIDRQGAQNVLAAEAASPSPTEPSYA